MFSARRSSLRIHAQLAVTSTSAHNFFTGFTENISEGGLFLCTYQLKPVGTQVQLTLRLEGGPEVDVTGEVRWVRDTTDDEGSLPPGMGLRFINLDPEGQQAIEAFIESKRETMFYDLDDD